MIYRKMLDVLEETLFKCFLIDLGFFFRRKEMVKFLVMMNDMRRTKRKSLNEEVLIMILTKNLKTIKSEIFAVNWFK